MKSLFEHESLKFFQKTNQIPSKNKEKLQMSSQKEVTIKKEKKEKQDKPEKTVDLDEEEKKELEKEKKKKSWLVQRFPSIESILPNREEIKNAKKVDFQDSVKHFATQKMMNYSKLVFEKHLELKLFKGFTGREIACKAGSFIWLIYRRSIIGDDNFKKTLQFVLIF